MLLERDATVRYFNRNGPETLDMIGRKASEFLEDGSRQRFDSAVEQVFDTGQPDEQWFRSGVSGDWRTRFRRVVAADGTRYVQITGRIIDPPKTEELQGDRFRLALETAAVGLWAWDAIHDRISMDERAREVFQLVGKELPISVAQAESHVFPEDLERVRRRFARGLSGEAFSDLELRVRGPYGPSWIAFNGRPLFDATNTLLGLVGSCFDINQRHSLQEQLLLAQKMEAIGQLTAGISHNFNNILSAILPNLHLAARHVSADGTKFLRNAQLAGERASELISELMMMAGRRESESRKAIDLVETVERVVRICQTTFGSWVQLSLEIGEGVPPVTANEGQVEQVLLNLLLNARDAFEESRTSCPHVRIEVESRPSRGKRRTEVGLRVLDNGPGMPDDIRGRVFEPFFTTKGAGTGLGLATAYAIVSEHGGTITCTSEPDTGTAFEILLPAASAEVPLARPIVKNRVSGGSERILLVDDEPLVRAVTSATLQDVGYQVIEAKDGTDALALFCREPKFDLVIVDIAMPETPGDVLLQQIRNLNRDQLCLVFTGLSGEKLWALNELEILRKPAGVHELLAAVRKVLDSKSKHGHLKVL